MEKNQIQFIEKTPSVKDYIELRKSVDWGATDTACVERGLSNSIYCICVVQNNKLIGFGRIVGDGATVFYIQDIIVSPKYQNQNIGTKIMEKIMSYVNNNCPKGAIVGLIAIKNLDNFYTRFGLVNNQNNGYYRFFI